MENYHYVQSIWDVKQLLKEWKLENIWPHLMAEKIDGEILQMIKISHIRMLLGNFPLGIQIRFEYNLEQWRYSIGRPLQSHRCEGRCEFPAYRQSSSPPQQRVFNDISQATIPTAEALYTNPKQINPIQIDTQAAKKTSQSPKDPLLMNNNTPPETPTTCSQASTPSSKINSPMPYTTKPHGPVPKVKLREILMKCQPEGPQLMQIYKVKNAFSRPERRRLVTILVNYYLSDDLQFSLQTSYALERAILKMFPSERLDMYRRAKRGSIYCKYMSAKPLYTKKLQKRDTNDTRISKMNQDVFDNSDMETGCFSDDTSSLRGRGGNRNSSGCFSINEDDSAPTVANMAHDDDDGKSQYTFSYVPERDVKDVKPTIIEDSEISIQTAYRLHREVIMMTKPFAYGTFLTQACTIYGTTDKMENFYMTVNDCEINKNEFVSVIRQYYKLPTFVVELKLRSSFSSELELNNNDVDSVTTEYDVSMSILQTNLPVAKDIRSIPPLKHIVLLSNASKPLENKHRTSIAKAVIDESLSLQPDRTLKRQDYLTLAQNICEAFPGEKETTYYVPSQPNHPARGKLWCYFKNKRHFLSTTGVVKTRLLKRRTKLISSEDESENSLNKEEIENHSTPYNELMQFEENSSLNFESFKTKWLETHKQRWQTLVEEKLTPSEYMQRYSILKSLQGINLMEIDMQLLYPQMGTMTNWMQIYNKVVKKMRMKKVSEFVKRLIKNITEAKDDKYCASLALALIPYLFPHNGRKNELSGERGTKLEIQERFVKEFKSLDDLRSDPHPVDLQLRYVHTDQRIIYAEFSISGFIFKCCDLLEALSCLFHYMKGMNIEYPISCNHIWQFIQYAIFRIELTGVKWPYVESTISDLYLS